ncbi:MAG TPA: squalene/phytoene synthase family protein, partial [Candidatus Magasanikbacteria bacterium]|nr:squalene/phytoene synthase family protein [Candidatus Magasanikbacteria bacterium]
YINFIRDISEDIGLGRQYIPLEVLRPFGFENLTEATALANPQAFKNVIQQELERYREWQKQGEAGFSYFSRRTLLPIKTAADMYRYTAKVIASDPFIIFKTKVKPSKARIVKQLICNLV